MKRVEDVLGKGWELYSDGQKLADESTTFKKKLDSKHVCSSIYIQLITDILLINLSLAI
jgi:dynein heavy chain 1, cytosolic